VFGPHDVNFEMCVRILVRLLAHMSITFIRYRSELQEIRTYGLQVIIVSVRDLNEGKFTKFKKISVKKRTSPLLSTTRWYCGDALSMSKHVFEIIVNTNQYAFFIGVLPKVQYLKWCREATTLSEWSIRR
jgi:hypothetical protein